MSGLIIVPQIIVALLAPWVGFHSEKRGRRPLLLIGFALEPIRAVLLAFTGGYAFLIVGQVLSGITGAMIGVLTIPVITDLTANTGRFNLAVGVVGALSSIAAALSTSSTGPHLPGFGSAHRLSTACRHRGGGDGSALGISVGDKAGKIRRLKIARCI